MEKEDLRNLVFSFSFGFSSFLNGNVGICGDG